VGLGTFLITSKHPTPTLRFGFIDERNSFL
jgi:hypothetical protein